MRLIALPSCRTPCVLLSDGRGGLPVEAVFEDVSADELAAALAGAPVAPDVPYGCLLVRAPDALVLVDTGLGAAEHPFPVERAASCGRSSSGRVSRSPTLTSSSCRTGTWITSAVSRERGGPPFRERGT